MSAKRTQEFIAALDARVDTAFERSRVPVSLKDKLGGLREAGEDVPPARVELSRLRLKRDQQPRQMLPDDDWERLMREGGNDPAGTLEALQQAAQTHPSSRSVLEHVQELARSIRSEGVLLPLTVVRAEDDTYVVLDGHCRAMGSVLARETTAPVRLEEREEGGLEAELSTASHSFILNWTQQKLTPLDSARLLEGISRLAARIVLARQVEGEEPVEVERALGELVAALEGAAPADPDVESQPEARPDLDDGQRPRPGQTRTQTLAAAVRKLVLEKTGLTWSRYYELYRLRRLNPEAQALATGLSEGHLQAIIGAPTALHPLLVKLVQAANASVKETRAYCRAAREQGEDFLVRRYAEVLRSREGALRRRTAVSWEPLLRAVPEDLTPRISALRAELAALDEARRAVRLRSVEHQRRLIEELGRAYDEILTLYATTGGDPQGHEPAPD